MKRKSKWSDSEVMELEEKGFVRDRTNNSIRQKKTRLGLRVKCEHRKKWDNDQIDKLKEMRVQGLTAREIQKTGVFSFSINAIQKQMCRLGLAKKIKAFKFPKEIRQRFANFLTDNWAGKIPEDLVEIWNKENAKFPTNKRKVVSYLSRLKLKIPYGEVQRIKNLRRKLDKIHNSVDTSTNTLEKIRQERVIMMRKRVERGRDIWTGMPIDIIEIEV
jgi:hypothetical protein